MTKPRHSLTAARLGGSQVIGQPLRSAGAVVYDVVLKLDTVPLQVLPGMSARVHLHP